MSETIAEGTLVAGWKVTSLQRQGPTPRYLVSHPQDGRQGTLTCYPLHGPRGTRTQLLAERLGRLEGVSAPGLVPIAHEHVGDTLGVILPNDLERPGEAPLAPEAALAALEQVAKALAPLHAQGQAHGEVEASSLVKRGSSWGLLGPGAHTGPVELELLGLDVDPRYAAPEVLDGRGATPASDSYSLGLVLYRLLTGQDPVSAADASAAFLGRARVPAPDLDAARPDLPEGVRSLYRLLTCRARDLRPADASAVLAALATARRRALPPPQRVLPELRPAGAGVPLLLVLVLGGGLALGALALQRLFQLTSPAEGYAFPTTSER